MARQELREEELESISGGQICSGYSNKRGYNITYIDSDPNTYKINDGMNLIQWTNWVNTTAGEEHDESAIIARALREGLITLIPKN